MKNKLSTLLLCLWALGSAVGICIWEVAAAVSEGNFILALILMVLFLIGNIFGAWIRVKIQAWFESEEK